MVFSWEGKVIMDVHAVLKVEGRKTRVRQIVFDGEPFTALNLQLMRDRLVPRPG